MSCNVFANNNEIACKASENQTIAEFPDVCLSPPSPPAGPIPVPYPNTSFSKDMQNGSKTVMIQGQEVMLKDQSFYQTSPLGDEAATNSFGGSVVTHVITGKTYFVAWSMDVKFEDQNVDRHLDLTSSNHASVIGSPPPVVPSKGTMTVREYKDSLKWSRHVDPNFCKGKHDWECGKTSCPDCWQPPCVPNAVNEQKAYDEEQAKPNAEKAQNAKKGNLDKVTKNKMTPEGAACENATIDAVGEANVESAGYRAHCKKCHMEGDLDVVTADSVIECKKGSDALKLDQMQEKIIPIAQKCHPGKKIKVAVPKAELAKLENKLKQAPWNSLGLSAMGV
jgi:hypothetical protein